MYKIRHLLAMLALIGFTTSCTTYKNIAYFKDLPDTAREVIMNAHYNQLIIHPDDILSINIQTLDPTANDMFTQSSGSQVTGVNPANTIGQGSANTTPSQPGFLVDKNGTVELPVLGSFHLAGLTTIQARDTIQKSASLIYKSPAVYVRFANLKVTILGEVSHPGTYVLPNEKNTIFDALGLAGDLTIFGKRENALLIRDSAGYSTLTRFSLMSKDIVKQEFFFLKQNDVLYIEPNAAKLANLDAVKTRNYTIIVSILTLLIVIASRVN